MLDGSSKRSSPSIAFQGVVDVATGCMVSNMNLM
jgi:hypothetical protein